MGSFFSVPDETWCEKEAIRSTEPQKAFFSAGICANLWFVFFNIYVCFIYSSIMNLLIHWYYCTYYSDMLPPSAYLPPTWRFAGTSSSLWRKIHWICIWMGSWLFSQNSQSWFGGSILCTGFSIQPKWFLLGFQLAEIHFLCWVWSVIRLEIRYFMHGFRGNMKNGISKVDESFQMWQKATFQHCHVFARQMFNTSWKYMQMHTGTEWIIPCWCSCQTK